MSKSLIMKCEQCENNRPVTKVKCLDEYLCDQCIEKIQPELDYDNDKKQSVFFSFLRTS